MIVFAWVALFVIVAAGGALAIVCNLIEDVLEGGRNKWNG